MLRTSETKGQASPETLHVAPSVPLDELLIRQDSYFQSGATRSYAFRRQQLEKLKALVLANQTVIFDALKKDLRKHESESYLAEVGFLCAEISDAIKHLKKWMKPKKVSSPLVVWPARSRIVPEPLGRSLLISPWNYPFQLTLAPLVGSMAAGNVSVIKPSELAPNTAEILEHLINSHFPAEYIHVVTGGADLSQRLLEHRWDHIFFTGSTAIGKVIASAAAKHLTPCTLELGGKSPCLVTKNARLDVTVRRIVFGKFLNGGQTCVAPDYVLVEDSVHDAFVQAMKQEIRLRFGMDPLSNSQLPKIINRRHFDRLMRLIEPSKVSIGGRNDLSELLIEPTLLTGIKMSDPVMQEEIFGPILPVIPYKDLNEAKSIISGFEKPLALYLFSESELEQAEIINTVSFGGGCINDTLMHLANPKLPFGGVGASGTGAYHGQYSFEIFSHMKAVLVNSTNFDLPARYAPWTQWKDQLMRWILK